MTKKTIIIATIILIIILSGCITQTENQTKKETLYICQTGETVTDIKLCPKITTAPPTTTTPPTTTPTLTTIPTSTATPSIATKPPIAEIIASTTTSTTPKPQKETTTELEECKEHKFTVSPIEIDEIREISPLGSINPPGHTIPTEHTYLFIDQEFGGQKMLPLKSPGDIYITAISSADDQLDPTRKEYVIDFSLCKELHGFYNHVKELSDELKEVLSEVECEKWDINPGNLCTKKIFYEVKAGTVIGEVGHKQGNFDFGAYDYRIKHDFINPKRYGYFEEDGLGPRTLYKVCPYDYYTSKLKEELYTKLQNNGQPKCGKIMQDIRGTLQGNWFFGEARQDYPSTWNYDLSFVYEHADPSLPTISIAGHFTEKGKWRFTEETSGSMNRKFSDVTPDGNIYCFEGIDPYIAIDTARTDFKHEGKIIVQLISDTELKIEHQSGRCSGDELFINPASYNR